MLSSPALSWALTAVFAVTGAAALLRLVRPATAPGADGRTAELAHLLMSVAMIAMVWGRGGTPGTALGTVQIVVFALLALALLLSAMRRHGGHARVGDACHLTTTLAMVWMVAASPALMGGADAAAMHGINGTDGMEGMEGMDAAVGAHGTAGSVAVDVAAVVALLLVAAWWALRARRGVPAGQGDGAVAGAPVRRGGLVAVCHLLMSLGMASMLLAML